MYKVLIRPLIIEDASISYYWRNDSEVWEYTGNRPNIVITEEIEKKWIADKLNESNSKRFAIEVDNLYVGNIQLTSITKSDAEFHIFIGNKDYWGKGIAYSAIQQILRFADYTLKLDKVFLKVNPAHEKAIKLYERCGFIKKSQNIEMEINLKERNKPMIGIFSMVYNHAPFLEQCLESILMQKCLFDFEIVVGEDLSKDNSREILSRYQSKYPGKFKMLFHDKNIGAIKNQILTLEACNGKYIALCEGDDYWTDPYKLQKQVDFLEANTNVVLHAHQAFVMEDTSKMLKLYSPYHKDFILEKMTLKINSWNIPTLSVMFRNKISKFPDWFYQVKSGDFFLYNILAQYGSFFFSSNNMGIYRNHIGGVSKQLNRIEWILSNIESMRQFSKTYNCFWPTRRFFYNCFIELHQLYLEKGDKKNSLLSLYKASLYIEISFFNINHICKYTKDILLN